MRADRVLGIAYENGAGSVLIGVWPQAGFSSIAYRLAKLCAPRGVVTLAVVALFYLL